MCVSSEVFSYIAGVVGEFSRLQGLLPKVGSRDVGEHPEDCRVIHMWRADMRRRRHEDMVAQFNLCLGRPCNIIIVV